MITWSQYNQVLLIIHDKISVNLYFGLDRQIGKFTKINKSCYQATKTVWVWNVIALAMIPHYVEQKKGENCEW